MTPPLEQLLEWQRDGTARIEAAVAGLPDNEFTQPCGLPGWQRSHLVAHLARNADALVHLLDWAATGVPTPMYTDARQRARDIEDGGRHSPSALRDDLLTAHKRYADAVAALPAPAWSAMVRSAQGRDIPASDVPWLRVREVWIHLVDLHCGHMMAGLPVDLVTALLDDVTTTLGRKPDAPSVTLESGDGRWSIGASPAVTVRGTPAALLGWLTGRGDGAGLDGPLPVLPRWL